MKHWKLSDDKTTIEHVGTPKYEFGVRRVLDDGAQKWISQIADKTWASSESLKELTALLDFITKSQKQPEKRPGKGS